MSTQVRMSRRRTRFIATTAVVGLTAATAYAVGGQAIAAPGAPDLEFEAGHYVVLLNDAPAALYRGGIAGYAATAADDGEEFRATASATERYTQRLERRQEEIADDVEAEPTYHYSVAVNGFAAELSGDQVAELVSSKDVLAVVPDEPVDVDTVTSPEFLGLDGTGGVWDEIGGAESTGEGVVVGVLDTGIWPENPSFAGEPLTSEPSGEVGQPYYTSATETAMQKANGDLFTGACERGEEWTADDCNDKLISARYFPSGFLANVPEENRSEFEYISARDNNGHGSHTAGTAAGNHGVPMEVNGRDFGEGSGMAPAAKIAAYKVCWEDTDPNTGGCYPSDIVAAIDQAIIDNVDVINFSISGTLTNVVDPTELAFLSAASANIFVAASAGNSGPGISTVAHNSPWLTTVAASTHVNYEGTVELGNGERYRGSMIDDHGLTDQTPLVYAGDIGADGADPAEVALCAANTLDAAQAAGKVVVCDRGAYARVDKSAEVARAGGVGTILANVNPGESLDADFHSTPTVHIDAESGDAVRAYLGEDSPTAALLVGDQTGQTPLALPVIAGFSSRGPALAAGGDLLKPDIAAPGVSVLAAVAPRPNGGNDFNLISGTSMAAPHVAGLAALIKGERTDWSPAAVRSAMVTTAADLKNPDGSVDTNFFNGGAGEVDPTRFLSPGLVYETDVLDYLSYIEGTGIDLGIPGLEPIDPSDLNQPSIAVGALAGEQTITRSVTADTPGVYVAKVDVPGFKAKVRPQVLHFSEAGQTKQFTVTLTRKKATLDEYAQGELTWRGGGTTVTTPIVAKPVVVAAPDEVTGTGTDGSASYDVVSGTSDDVNLAVHGLTPGDVTDGTLTPGEPPSTVGNESSQLVSFDVPEGTELARFDLVSGDDSADYDMYLFGPDGQQLPVSGATGGSSEQVDLTAPSSGTHYVVVHLYSSDGGVPVDFSLRNFAVGSDAGNATVTPDAIQAALGGTEEVTVNWSGLDADTPYLGAVSYEGSSALTTVMIE